MSEGAGCGAVRRVPLERLRWAFVSGRYRALNHDFALRTTDAALGRYLAQALGALAERGPARLLYSAVSPTADGQHVLYVDGEEEVSATSLPQLCRGILSHVNQEVIADAPDHVLIHGSAAEQAGRAVLFPAPMESGKTTMVAGLVRAGLRYLTDEAVAVAVAPEEPVVHAYPKWLALDPGSWALFPELRPAPGDGAADCVEQQWHVDPRRLRPDAVAPAGAPAFVIALRFAEGARSRLEPITRAEGLEVLVENAFNLQRHGERGFQALAEVARRSACYRLTTGELEPAVKLVTDLLA